MICHDGPRRFDDSRRQASDDGDRTGPDGDGCGNHWLDKLVCGNRRSRARPGVVASLRAIGAFVWTRELPLAGSPGSSCRSGDGDESKLDVFDFFFFFLILYIR